MKEIQRHRTNSVNTDSTHFYVSCVFISQYKGGGGRRQKTALT